MKATYYLKDGSTHTVEKDPDKEYSPDTFSNRTIHRLITSNDGKNVFFTGDRIARIEVEDEESK